MSLKLSHFFIVLVLGALFTQLGLNCAKAEPPYEVTLEDEFGNRLPTYAHRGEWFAQGRDGQRYNVRITNRTGRLTPNCSLHRRNSSRIVGSAQSGHDRRWR